MCKAFVCVSVCKCACACVYVCESLRPYAGCLFMSMHIQLPICLSVCGFVWTSVYTCERVRVCMVRVHGTVCVCVCVRASELVCAGVFVRERGYS